MSVVALRNRRGNNKSTTAIAAAGSGGKSTGLLETIFGATNMEASDWPTDPVQKARIFNTSTRPTFRLKYALDANPMGHFQGDIDTIVDVIKLFVRQVRSSNVHILYALKRFFWALRVLARAVKNRAERNRNAAAKFVEWWASKEEELREEYYTNVLSANYLLHHSVEDSLAEFHRTCTPTDLKEAVVRTLMYRRRVEYLRKRRQWKKEYDAKVKHLDKLKHLYRTLYTKNTEPSEASEQLTDAITEARKSAAACALSCPTLTISQRNVSLEQLLGLCAELQRKKAKQSRAVLLDHFEKERMAEKESRRQAFVQLALKREAERKQQLLEKKEQERQEAAAREAMEKSRAESDRRRAGGRRYTTIDAFGDNGDLAASGALEDDPSAASMSFGGQSLATRRTFDGSSFHARKRRATLAASRSGSFFVPGDEPSLDFGRPRQLPGLDDRGIGEDGDPLELDDGATPRRGAAVAGVSPTRRLGSPRPVERPDVRGAAYDHVVSETVALLRRSAARHTSPTQHRQHPRGYVGANNNTDASGSCDSAMNSVAERAVISAEGGRKAKRGPATQGGGEIAARSVKFGDSSSPQEDAASVASAAPPTEKSPPGGVLKAASATRAQQQRTEALRAQAEAAAAERHAARLREEHAAEVRRLVSSRGAPPPLPSFFTRDEAQQVTVTEHSVSALHMGSGTRPRPLDLEISSDGRLVDRKSAETRKHFSVYRFLAGVTASVPTKFGALAHVTCSRVSTPHAGARPGASTSALEHPPRVGEASTRRIAAIAPLPIGNSSTSLAYASTPTWEHGGLRAVGAQRDNSSIVRVRPISQTPTTRGSVLTPTTADAPLLAGLRPSFLTPQAKSRCESTVRDLIAMRKASEAQAALSPARAVTRALGLSRDEPDDVDVIHFGRAVL